MKLGGRETEKHELLTTITASLTHVKGQPSISACKNDYSFPNYVFLESYIVDSVVDLLDLA